MACTRFFYDFQRDVHQTLRKEKLSFLHGHLSCPNLHFHKNHEDILKIVYGQMAGQTDRLMDRLVDSAIL